MPASFVALYMLAVLVFNLGEGVLDHRKPDHTLTLHALSTKSWSGQEISSFCQFRSLLLEEIAACAFVQHFRWPRGRAVALFVSP